MKAQKTERRPRFGLGFNGHAISCLCVDCCASRAQVVKKNWASHGRAAELDRDKTIFVPSYWRGGRQRPENRRAMLKLLFGKGR